MKHIFVNDERVLNIWEDEDNEEYHISPAYYQDSGTPCDGDTGEQYEYSHTELVTDAAYFCWKRKVSDPDSGISYIDVESDDELEPSKLTFSTVEDAHDAVAKGIFGGHMTLDDLADEGIVLVQVAIFEI